MKLAFIYFLLNFLSIFSQNFAYLDFELIFSLQDYFESDVILLATCENDARSFEIIKKFYKYKKNSPKVFLGVINLNTNSEIMPKTEISFFQNILIVSDCGKFFITKLVEVRSKTSKKFE